VDTEHALLEHINRGDGKARQELYQRFAGTAMAVAMRFLADSDAARDVLQEAFIKVFTHLDRFSYRGEGSLRSWVMRVVSNEAIDWLKQKQRFTFTDLSREEDLPDEEPDVGDISPEQLQQFIERLPDGYRQVLVLYVFEQKSHQEIARLLGIKENSSASQFLRAKRLLAKMINDFKRHQR